MSPTEDISTRPNKTPRVSVVIPVRDGIAFIWEALDSVLSQSFSDLEILVMDDGSEDYDYQELRTIDPRILVTRLDGAGVSHARNEGIRIARGEFIAFLDSDDVWFPGKLEAQIRHFEGHQKVGVVFGASIRWLRNLEGGFPPADSLVEDCSQLVEIDPKGSGWIYTRLLMGLLVGMNTAVIRRQVALRLGGFDESMRVGEDYDYWLRASRLTQMHRLDGEVALYRIHDASAMHTVSRDNDLAILLEAARTRWGLGNPDGTCISEAAFHSRLSGVEFSHGYMHYWQGDAKVACRSFWRALRQRHRIARSFTYLVLALIKMAGIRPKGATA